MGVIMIKTNIFQSNRTQAVRLPKAVALPETVKEVTIAVSGNSRIVTPVEQTWDAFFDGPAASADFMSGRDQPEPQDRDGF